MSTLLSIDNQTYFEQSCHSGGNNGTAATVTQNSPPGYEYEMENGIQADHVYETGNNITANHHYEYEV